MLTDSEKLITIRSLLDSAISDANNDDLTQTLSKITIAKDLAYELENKQ